ncbi:glycosyltransferase, partial [Actinophytocola gossypii]|nr:glycosyltransferase [Actinophytocola gossypii]
MGSLHRLNARPTSNNGVGSDERLAGSPLLSIVVPAKDEAENLPALTGRIRQALAGVVDYELVIVDDQSTDRTAAGGGGGRPPPPPRGGGGPPPPGGARGGS